MQAHRWRGENLLGCVILVVGSQVTAWAGDNTLRHEAIIDAPVEAVWEVWTTNEGFKVLGVALAEIDFRMGGKMLTHYDPNGVLGDPNTIENTILSFEPLRMLSIRCTKPPATFPYKTAMERMWSVIYFEPVGLHRTRVILVGMGYTDDEESRKMREHFDKGNAWTLAKLKEKFASASNADCAAKTTALENAIRSMIGEWTLDHTLPDGKLLRGRMVVEEILGGKFFSIDSWLGGVSELIPHGRAVFGRDPEGGGIRVWDFGEGGKVSVADAVPLSENRWAYDWRVQAPGGSKKRLYIEDSLEGRDSLRSIIFELNDSDRPGVRPEGREPMIDVRWMRSSGPSPVSGGQPPR